LVDFSGETFRIPKEKEEKQYGEYRTRRLVLKAWNLCSIRAKWVNAPNQLIKFSPFDKIILELKTK